jgi:hypothetical protein
MRAEQKTYNKKCAYCFNIVSYNRGEKEEVCPFCGNRNYIKIPIEQDLLECQNFYLKAREENNKKEADKHLSNIYFLLKKYAEGKIKKKIKHTVSYCEDKLEEKAEEVAVWFLEQYLQNPEFKVEHSFGGLMDGKILKALYAESEKRYDNLISLDSSVSDEDSTRLYDLIDVGIVNGSLEHSSLYDEFLIRQVEGENLIDSIMNIIDSALAESRLTSGLVSQVYFLIGLYAMIAGKSKEEMMEYFSMTEKSYTENCVEETIEVIYELIKDNVNYRSLYAE